MPMIRKQTQGLKKLFRSVANLVAIKL